MQEQETLESISVAVISLARSFRPKISEWYEGWRDGCDILNKSGDICWNNFVAYVPIKPTESLGQIMREIFVLPIDISDEGLMVKVQLRNRRDLARID